MASRSSRSDERSGAGEVVDDGDVGVEAVGEVLGPRRRDPVDEVVVDVGAGVGVDAGVVAVEVGVGFGEEPGEVGVGDDQPVLGDAAGQVGVGGFAVEAVDADGDRQVPGAALGAVGGEGVAVADPSATGQVALVQARRRRRVGGRGGR